MHLLSHIHVDFTYPNLLGFLSERQLELLSVLNLFFLKTQKVN